MAIEAVLWLIAAVIGLTRYGSGEMIVCLVAGIIFIVVDWHAFEDKLNCYIGFPLEYGVVFVILWMLLR